MTRREHALAVMRAVRVHARLIGRAPRRAPRLPKQVVPMVISRSYYRALADMLAAARSLVKGEIVDAGLLAAWEKEAGTWRRDAAGDEIAAKMDRLTERFFKEFPNDRFRRTADRFARAVSDKQKEQLGRQVRAALSVDVVQAEPWLEPRIAAFTTENVALIKSVPQKYFSEIEALVSRKVRDGSRPAEIADALEERFNVSESKAALIARDQVGKWFGELNKERQLDLGVDSAVWRTSNDERVRESHAELEGEKFDWVEPPIVDGEPSIPGQPIQCRCTGEPDFSGVLDALETP